MAKGDRAAIDVHFLNRQAERLGDRAGLRRERLVGLDQVEVFHAPAGLGQRRLRCRDRANAHN
jgi:hypothetical protein